MPPVRQRKLEPFTPQEHAMHTTRKQFLETIAAGSVLLLLKACGGGGDSATAVPAALCGADGGAISGNHGHVLSIARADLDSMVAKAYSIRGSATHDHAVSLSAAELQELKAGKTVTVASSLADLHVHAVTIVVAAVCP
jgi:hypothetical protein